MCHAQLHGGHATQACHAQSPGGSNIKLYREDHQSMGCQGDILSIIHTIVTSGNHGDQGKMAVRTRQQATLELILENMSQGHIFRKKLHLEGLLSVAFITYSICF